MKPFKRLSGLLLDPSREIKLESKQSITTGNINSNGGRFTSASFANPLPLSSADLDQTGGAGQSAPFLPESPTFAIAQLSNPISEKPSIINQTTNSPPPETKQKVSDTPSVDPCRYNNSVLDVRASSDLAVDDLDIVAGQLVDSNQFIQCFEQTLARAKEQKNVNAEELALYNLGVLMFRLGDYLRSRGYYEQNISLLNSLGSSRQSYPQVKRISLSGLGTVYSALGVYPKAIYLYNESLNILPQNRDANLLDNPRIRAFIQRSLGIAYLNQGEIEQSQEKFNKSVFYQTILRTIFEAEAETRILPLYVTS